MRRTPKSASRTKIEPAYMGIGELAIYASVSERLIEKALADGRLPARKLGRRVLIKISDLDRLLEPVAG